MGVASIRPVDNMQASGPLLQRVAAGDARAARQFYERYQGFVMAMARRFLRSSADVEDITQDILFEVHRTAHRFDPTRAPESAYVATVARRRLIDAFRRRKAERHALDVERMMVATRPTSREPLPRADVRTAARALLRLRPPLRRAVYFSVVGGLAHSEIARRMAVPLGTVKSHIRRGLAVVRAEVASLDHDDGHPAAA
jgi:RNA polymerase sigma-70 factor (ECF subfamily)